jgi:hypothetical protein
MKKIILLISIIGCAFILNAQTSGSYVKVFTGVDSIWKIDTSFYIQKGANIYTLKDSIGGGGGIDTDSQSIYLSNDTLYITRGNFVSLEKYVDTIQNLYLNIDTLSIGGGNFIILPFTDTTSLSNRIDAKQDSQSLSLLNDTLFISRGNSVILNNDRQRTITTNITLTNDYDGKIVLIKGTCTITIPIGLRSEFNCVFRTFSGFVGTFVGEVGTTIDAPKGLILRNFSMATIFKDGSSTNYILDGDLIFN